MKERKIFRGNIKYLCILLCCTIIPKIFIALLQNPIQVSDEVGALVAPAYFAGLDWSDVAGRVSYYGTGYHFIFALLFKITSNPYVIYRAILISYVFIEALGGVIVFYLCEKHFVKDNPRLSCALGIMVVYLQYNKDTWITNEAPIFLLVWIVALLVIELYDAIENKKRKYWLSGILCLVLAYSLTIHTRMLFLYALVIVIVLYVLICKRKSLVAIPVCVIAGPLFYWVAQSYNGWIQNVAWMQYRTGAYLHNASAAEELGRLSNLAKLNTKLYWHSFLNTIVGQVNTANVMTIGIFMLALVLGLCVVFRILKDKAEDKWLMNCGIFAVYGGIGCMGLLGLQAVLWLERAKQTMELGYGTTVLNSSINYSRVFVYLRYFAPFMGPIVLMSMVYIYKKRIWNAYIASVVLTLIVQAYWLRYNMRILYNNIDAARVYIPFSLSNYTQKSDWWVYLPGTIILLIAIFIIGIMIKKNKIMMLTIMLSGVLIYQYMYYGIVHKSEWEHRANAGYELITALEQEIELKKELVVPYSAMAYTYQVMFSDYHIEMDLPSVTEDALIFTNRFNNYKFDEFLTDYGYVAYMLDDNEYLYVINEDIIAILDTWGYSRFTLTD